MRLSSNSGRFALAALISIGSAGAQPSTAPDPEVGRVRTEFEYGKYADALKRASERIDRGGLSDSDRPPRSIRSLARLSASAYFPYSNSVRTRPTSGSGAVDGCAPAEPIEIRAASAKRPLFEESLIRVQAGPQEPFVPPAGRSPPPSEVESLFA